MRIKLKRMMAGVATMAVAATVVPLVAAPTAFALGISNGAMPLTPATGNSATAITIDPANDATGNQKCPGDSASGNYRWQTFMAPTSIDPATLTFSSTGPNSQGGAFVQPLFDTGGNPVVQRATDIGNGNISGIPQVNFAVFGPGVVPAGAYNIGIACTLGAAGPDQLKTYWAQPISITTNTTTGGPSQLSYAQTAAPAVPAAPTLTSVTPGNGALTASFTPGASEPATTGFTATATPTGGGTPVTATGAASPFAIPGLTNGTQYSVTVRATNSVGNSAESNALLGTPFDENARPAVQNLTATPGAAGSGIVDLDWDAPTGITPTGYTVAVDPSAGTSTVDSTNTSASVTGLTPGTTYTFTVTPTHPSPFFGAPATVSGTATASGVTVLTQDVTVTRPAGALVFTQVCENSSTGAPLTGATFGAAPCAIAFGTATRVTTGPDRGRFFTAAASLNNVRIESDGDDTGWSVTGAMSAFTTPGTGANPGSSTRTFSGDQLGWTPAVVSTTTGMVATAGTPVPAGTVGGLGNGESLGSSAAGSSLGIAELDAALSLKIPVQARAGLYSGTLTLTATPGA